MNRLAAIAAAALTLAAAGCSSTADDTAAPGTSVTSAATSSSAAADGDEQAWLDPHAHVEAILAGVDPTDALGVGRAIAEIACTWSPVIDSTETASLLRAAPLLTPDYAATIVEPARGASQAIFIQAAAAKAVSIPSAQQRTDIVDGPPSTDTTQYLAYAVTWNWTTTDQQTTDIDDPRVRTVYVVLQKQPGGTWLASSVDYQDQQKAD